MTPHPAESASAAGPALW